MSRPLILLLIFYLIILFKVYPIVFILHKEKTQFKEVKELAHKLKARVTIDFTCGFGYIMLTSLVKYVPRCCFEVFFKLGFIIS